LRLRRLGRALALAAAMGGGGALALAIGCSSTVEAYFTGTPKPVLVTAEEIEQLGAEVPRGFETIGVVTAACETLNGAAGVFEAPCAADGLTGLLRGKAAESGATAIADLSCRKEQLSSETESVDGGGVTTTTRDRLTCQATAVRGKRGAGHLAVVPRSQAPTPQRGRRVVVGDASVYVAFAPSSSYTERPPRPEGEVGELADPPAGYAQLGTASSVCADACSPSQARRALIAEAARVGATAVASVTCELDGADRWRCEGQAIGDAVPAADAGE
jgi:hypothetical protein